MDPVRLLGMEATYSHTKLGVVLAATATYVASVLVLHGAVGSPILMLVTIPVLLASWSFGVRAALIVAALAFPMNMFLATAVVGDSLREWMGAGGLLGTLVLLATGVVVGRLRALGARVKQELSEREVMQSALRESEECYRALFESAPMGIAITEAGGIIVQTNSALERIL
ncbi:MAG: PAS domain S-box protein, partial [Chloroflexi bacterium]|nr:PAS domain S-box protein [Chloroflexota bacterium]